MRDHAEQTTDDEDLPASRLLRWIDAPHGLDDSGARALLGGKGAALASMVQDLDLRVPPAFVLTTTSCREFLASGWPAGLRERIAESTEELGRRTGRQFGGAVRPMLVSVRSGAPASMPGMMDTVLNVGMTPEVRDAFALETGPEFAAQTWLRFCCSYAEIVLGVPAADVAEVARGAMTADEMISAGDALAKRHSIPTSPEEQVQRCVEAVYRSWHSPRAVRFREAEGIDVDLGTAVTVQAMVFGNLDDDSGTGVVFTRSPMTGEDGPCGDYLPRAQGEDVVAGGHDVLDLAALEGSHPSVHAELVDICRRLELHARDMCDIEFTVMSGELYILQTRVGRRSPQAAVRLAVEMAQDPDFPLDHSSAVSRIDQQCLDGLRRLTAIRPGISVLTSGAPSSPGVGVGIVCTDPDEAVRRAEAGEELILVRAETSPADVHGILAASGVLTSLGGAMSHAAVVARGWGIPAVTGASDVSIVPGGIRVGDRFVIEGETVTVDGSTGNVHLGDARDDQTTEFPELQVLRRWAAESGVELGGDATDATEDAPVTDPSASEFTESALLRVVQLKGAGTLQDIATSLRARPTDVESAVDAATTLGLVADKAGRLRLTEDGRERVDAAMSTERSTVDVAALNRVYERFLPLNLRFKEVVTAWQSSERDDDAHGVLIDALTEIQETVRPIAQALAAELSRTAVFEPRFDLALTASRNGDQSMIASPLKDSYHTVWFEFHEELIHASGRNRRDEEYAGN